MTLPQLRRNFGLRVTGALVSVALASPIFAQTTAESPGASGAAILQMLLALALIIGILFVGAYLLRRLNGGQRFGHAGPMKVIGGLMISTRERILLIEVGNDWLVVGVVPGQIKTLHTQPKGELPPEHTHDKPFGHWLRQIAERNHADQ